MNGSWTALEDAELIALWKQKAKWAEVAEKLDKTEGSARSRLYRLQKQEERENRTDALDNFKVVLSLEPEPLQEERNRPEAPRVFLKAAVFDIETTDFGTDGYFGHLICCSILPLDADKPTTFAVRFEDNRDDRRVLDETVEALSEYQILIGHNCNAFDRNWLYSRIMFHGLRIPPDFMTYDTYQAARRIGIATSKRLGSLGDYFGVEGVKTSVFKTSWSMIDSPYRKDFDKALHDIQWHCEQDVIMNRNVFDNLWLYDGDKKFVKTKW